MSRLHAKAEIIHLDDKGVVVVKDRSDDRLYAVTFNKIKGYKGQTAREFGLRMGRILDISGEDGKVSRAELVVG